MEERSVNVFLKDILSYHTNTLIDTVDQNFLKVNFLILKTIHLCCTTSTYLTIIFN